MLGIPSLPRFDVLLCAAAVLSFSVLAQAAPPAHVQILVKPKAHLSEAALHALLSAHGAQETDVVPALNVRIVRVPSVAAGRVVEALSRNKDVEYAEPDFQAKAIGTANDPFFVDGSEWHLAKIQAPSAWDITAGSAGIVIAVVDTGANYLHPDLRDKLLPGYDFVSNDSDPSDDNGHGTAAAGCAAPSTNNSVGVAGVAWSSPILPVKVLDAAGSGSYSAIANGITYAADKGARLINLSLGGTYASRTLQDAVNYAWNKNAVLIAAAGNNGNSTPVYPAACENVVAVSATNSSDTQPAWSNYGTYVDISAPGESVLSLHGADAYAWWSGTSFSCPVAAGVVALMASANPKLTNVQLVDLLLKNSDDIGTSGYDVYYGHGRVNAYRATAAAQNTATVDTSLPVVSILSPADGSSVSATISVPVSATDNVGVTRIELWVGSQLVSQSSTASATFSLNTQNFIDGWHILQARAFDAAGNVGTTSISIAVQNSTVLDTTAPTVAITSPADGSTVARTQRIYVTGSDNRAVTKLELYIDGKIFGSSTSSSATFSWNTAKVAKGAHKLQAYAYDAAGNVGPSALVTVYK